MSRSGTILLADDDIDDQEMLVDVLNGLDPSLTIHAVENGRQALAYLAAAASDQSLPGMIVLDYHMPIFSAIEVLEKMRENEAYANIPVVVWSTSKDADHERLCIEKGASRYFVKPTSHTLLQAIGKEILSMASGESS